MTGLLYELNNESNGRRNPRAPSCDQVIPKGGYEEGNMRWCSGFYNTLKMDLSEEEVELFLYNYAITKGWVKPNGLELLCQYF